MALTSRLIEEGIDPSVGSVGDALDNAMAETTVGSFKTELIRRQRPWRDIDQVELATAEWVEWFNTERPHNELDDFPPKRSRGSTTLTDSTCEKQADPTSRVSGHSGASQTANVVSDGEGERVAVTGGARRSATSQEAERVKVVLA